MQSLFRGMAWLVMASTLRAPAAGTEAHQPTNIIGYTVKGWYSTSFFGHSATSAIEQIFRYEINVASNLWRLSVLHPNHVVSCYAGDGKTTVEWLVDPNFSELPYPTPAIIYQAGYPADGYIGMIPWLAFASAHYLRNAQNTLPHPTIAASQSPQAFLYRADISRAQCAPHLPAQVVFRVDKSKKSTALKNPLLRLEGLYKGEWYARRKSVQQLVNGQARAEYSVLAWTNIGQGCIPRLAEIKVFHSGFTNRLLSSYLLVVNDVSVSPLSLTWPTSSNGWAVVDRRFRVERQGIDNIHYVTNILLPPMQDPWLQELFAVKKASFPFVRLDTARELIINFIFALLLLFPVALIALRWPKLWKAERHINSPDISRNRNAKH